MHNCNYIPYSLLAPETFISVVNAKFIAGGESRGIEVFNENNTWNTLTEIQWRLWYSSLECRSGVCVCVRAKHVAGMWLRFWHAVDSYNYATTVDVIQDASGSAAWTNTKSIMPHWRFSVCRVIKVWRTASLTLMFTSSGKQTEVCARGAKLTVTDSNYTDHIGIFFFFFQTGRIVVTTTIIKNPTPLQQYISVFFFTV